MAITGATQQLGLQWSQGNGDHFSIVPVHRPVTGRSRRARVDGTRIGVHDVIGLIVNGATVDDVCRSFPDLKRSHLSECLAYYEDHRAEIDDLVADQMHDPNA